MHILPQESILFVLFAIIVILLFLATRLRGRSTVTVFKRSIASSKMLDAMTLIISVVSLAMVGAIVICATSGVSLADALFECASALGTVGMTTGVTSQLILPTQLMIILFMYFGRVGILTLSLGFLMGSRTESRYQYAHTNILIG